MKLTKEQYDIIHSTGNIKINAVAGSGKTTTVIEYAKARPKSSRILYLAFNKTVKLEAIKRFKDEGLPHVTVETAHSLAFRYIVRGNQYQVKGQGYKTNEIAQMLNLQGNQEKHTEYIIANHINRFIAYFCNSDQQKAKNLNYPDTITDPKAKAFVIKFYDYIVMQSRILLAKMDKGEIEITHDFYLKKFQLSKPVLPYDYILFDEAQDASPAMLDVFLQQKATKVIVGDTHQQIYGWRFAVNSLEKADFKNYYLSTSFRFSQDIADLAMGVLDYKKHLESTGAITIKGLGKSKAIKTKAILARTNLGLLLKAIEFITEKPEVKYIYFEGNIHSYTYADEGASLYDVLNLYNGKRQRIRDPLIQSMKDLDDLNDYIKKTEDFQLGMMVQVVQEYGDQIPEILKTIKQKHVENEHRDKAEMIFSTVHRCKGMEYDAVELVKDFITEKALEDLKEEKKEGKKEDKKEYDLNMPKLNEEINLLYVAITRTKNKLLIPASFLPKEFKESPQIQVIQPLPEPIESGKKQVNISFKAATKSHQPEKTYSVEKVKTTPKKANAPWTPELDMELTEMFCKGVSGKEMATHFGRTNGSIASRIKKLELYDLYG
jgi:superfamily I DNA/RNA helicase